MPLQLDVALGEGCSHVSADLCTVPSDPVTLTCIKESGAFWLLQYASGLADLFARKAAVVMQKQ